MPHYHSHTLHLNTKPSNTQCFIEVLCFTKGHPDRFFFYSEEKFNAWQHDIKGRTQWAAILSPHCKYLNVDQAGFCKGHSTGEQVLTLTAYIENGLESKFWLLTSAYVWSGIKASCWNSGNAPCLVNGQQPNPASYQEVQRTLWTKLPSWERQKNGSFIFVTLFQCILKISPAKSC